jgi:hypothetical protein
MHDRRLARVDVSGKMRPTENAWLEFSMGKYVRLGRKADLEKIDCLRRSF